MTRLQTLGTVTTLAALLVATAGPATAATDEQTFNSKILKIAPEPDGGLSGFRDALNKAKALCVCQDSGDTSGRVGVLLASTGAEFQIVSCILPRFHSGGTLAGIDACQPWVPLTR